MKRLIGLILLMIMMVGQGSFLHAQVAVGQFRDHQPYHSFYSLAVTGDVVYAAGKNSIMYLYKSDISNSETKCYKWSKVDGLSDVEVARIAFDKQSQCLVIAYTNGNIDFVKDEVLTNVPDVKNKQIIGSKVVEQIYFDNQYCYMVYQFGVVVFRLDKYLVKETWFTNYQAELVSHALTKCDGKFYLATNQGVYSIDADNRSIADFAVWTRETGLEAADFNLLVTFQQKVYANRHSYVEAPDYSMLAPDSIYVLEGGQWNYMPELQTIETRSLNAYDDCMIFSTWQYYARYDGQQLQKNDQFSHGLLQQVQDAVLDGQYVWLADAYNGVWACNETNETSRLFFDDGPYSTDVVAMDCVDGTLVAVPGGFNGWAPAYITPSSSQFKDEKWSYLHDQFQEFGGTAHDIVNVAIDPYNPSIYYLASWGDGIYKCENGAVTAHYDESNSTLQRGDDGLIAVSGLCFDWNHNLWVTNTNSSTIINVLKSDGSWKAIPRLSGALGEVAQHIYADSRGFKWINFPRSSTHSLYMYYDNKTIDNTSDDVLYTIDMNAAATVESSSVKCVTEDKDGEIWIGTDKGIKVIYNPTNVLKGTAYPQNILLEQGGYVSVLLEFEEISSVAVDGANRKWIGTTKAGAFLMNESGTEELLHLTADNSALLSDVIYDVVIDGITGEVFFATDKGLCSYKGTATEGREDYSEVTVYPNPVRSGYTGVIAVNGLMENSFCKIVDAAGNLIWQGYANGGELIWDGKDFYGRRPATGVFFVFSSSESGKEKKVAKFLFIN